MKLRGKFEKHEINIGVSTELPNPEDEAQGFVFTVQTADVRYEKTSFEFELESVDNHLIRTPERDRCYRLISVMPQTALPEVEEELAETYNHYVSIEAAAQRIRALPEHVVVEAHVTDRVIS